MVNAPNLFYSNTWVQRVDLIGPGRKNAIAFVLDGIAFVGTGYNGVFLDDFYAYFGIVGVEGHELINSTAYPNPVVTDLTIRFSAQVINGSISIYSSNGKKVLDKGAMNSFEDGVQVDVRNWEQGVYYYHISDPSGNKLTSGKFIVSQ
jgi:hypothetical protein